MRPPAADRAGILERGAAALARTRPEGVPRAVAALLRAAFPGARCDVLARRRVGEGRAWTSLARRPASAAPLDLSDGSARLPAPGLHVHPAPEGTGLPGSAHLHAEGWPWRLVHSLRGPELKALLSVARSEPFSEDDAECLRHLAELARVPLATWSRVDRFRRTLRRARFLQRLLGDVLRSMESAQIAEACARRLREHVPADELTLVEPSNEAQEVAAWIVEPGGRARLERHAGRAASEARRLALAEAHAAGEIEEPRGPWEEDAVARGLRSLLVLPLESRRRHGGALLLAARDPRGLGPEHLPLLWPLARPLASALERAQLFREVSDKSRQMTALYEVGQALNSPLDTAGVIERVLSTLHDRAFRFQHSAVLTLESRDDGDWLVLQASRGYSLRDDSGFRMRVGDHGVTSRAVRTGRLVYVPDVRQDPHYVKGVESGRSEVAIPLVAGGQVVGVLDVESTEVNAFSAADLETLKLFSTQVALALQRARSFDDVRRQAMTDGLTGLLNQRYFKEKVDRELDRSRRTGRPFVLALIDVDDFKRVNDDHGHVVGDQVITAMGEVLSGRVRSIDAAARFGGDEFALILSEADLAQGRRVAEDVRQDVIERRPAGLRVSLSIGVVEWRPELVTFRDVVAAADRALYRAKGLGKGRVVADDPDAGPDPASDPAAARA